VRPWLPEKILKELVPNDVIEHKITGNQ